MKFKESEKCITVDSLNITRNIMMWDETMIQLSNVSAITTRPLNPIYVPWYPAAAVLLLLGLSGIQSYSDKTMGFLMIIAGAVMAFWCFNMNSERKEQTILTVQMNSGVSYFFMVKEKKILNKLLAVLAKIIADGGVGNASISISIKDCTIRDNARLFNGVNI